MVDCLAADYRRWRPQVFYASPTQGW